MKNDQAQPTEDVTADAWVSLQEASELLGVATSTVRRWADAGRVPMKRTLGGHRRFSRSAVAQLAHLVAREQTLVPNPSPTAADERELEGRAWHAQLAELPASQRMRELGQRLLGVLLQYINRRDDAERFLNEAQAVGVRYGAEARAAGISMHQTVEAFLLFRNVHAQYVVPLPPVSHVSDMADWLDVHSRVDHFMDTLLLGVVSGYEDATQQR